MPTVVIIKGKELDRMVDEGLNLLGGLAKYVKKNEKVVIKPNLCAIKTWDTGTTTDPKLVEEIVTRLKEITSDILIGESDHSTISAEYAFDALGYTELAKRHGIKIINLSDNGRLVELDNKEGFFLKKIALHEDLLAADLIINLPVMKTNEISVVTLALKNMIGVLPDREKARLHANIHEVIADINKYIKETLVIMDGRIAMEGDGPIDGEIVRLDLLVFADDPVAADCIGAKVMGIDPVEVKHIGLSEISGAGTTKNIQLKGEDLNSVIKKFKRPNRLSFRKKIMYWILGNRFLTWWYVMLMRK
jgi:uncharacterized protein (DUF362 family)